MPTLYDLGRVAAVSPHLDDAVLSCGELLACQTGSLVITVFAGLPSPGTALPPWDERCGFESPRQAMMQRRQEDAKALEQIDARPCWLDFLDAQYAGSDPPLVIARELADRLEAHRPQTVLMPLGLFHSDHARVHEAAMLARRALPQCRWLAYEDVPYRAIAGLVQQRLAALAQAGVSATPARLPPLPSLPRVQRKALALEAYASQWRGLGTGGRDDAAAPERCWLLEGPAPTQEKAHA